MNFIKLSDHSRNNIINVLIFFFIFCCFFRLGCSHKKPYYHPDVDKWKHTQITRNEIQQRIILLGDAGEPQEEEPVLQLLGKWSAILPDKSVVIFLGDNLYPSGLPPEDDRWRPEAERRLLGQINAVKNSGAKVIFIPGNHDWAEGGDAGLLAIKRQQEFVTTTLNDQRSFVPQNGCAGPDFVDLPSVRIIILDSNLWINQTLTWQSNCPQSNKQEFLEKYKELLTSAGDREVIVVAHHPLDTHGTHGGFYDWQDHIFPLTRLESWLWVPLPIIGSLYPLIRWHVLEINEDKNGPLYREMVNQFTEIMLENSPLVYAGGHDHSLQVLEGGEAADYILVCGAGAQVKLTKVGHGQNTLFAYHHTGFMVLDFYKSGGVLLKVVEPKEKEVVFQHELKAQLNQ